MWKPITLEELSTYIKPEELNDREKQLWELIKVSPEKWNEPEYGNEGGFWVVAIFGKKVIWYNDIEDGFNVSSYTSYGKIDDYYCNQDELEYVLSSLHSNKPAFIRDKTEKL